MNLYLRLIRVLLAARFGSRLNLVSDMSTIEFRVLPNDLDMNLHMNNGRYFTIMDLGRMDLIARSGVLSACWRLKWMPVLGAAKMNFLKPLNPFQKFTLRTRLVGWDEKWFYIEQSFLNDQGKIAATATVKGLFRSPRGNVPTAMIFEEIDAEAPGTLIPDAASALRTIYGA